MEVLSAFIFAPTLSMCCCSCGITSASLSAVRAGSSHPSTHKPRHQCRRAWPGGHQVPRAW
eukprot:1256990-Alexandrium_andersonii.AAC.1